LKLDPLYSDAFGKLLSDSSLDGSQKALALQLPGERLLGQAQEQVDVDGLHAAREFMRVALAEAHRDELAAALEPFRTPAPYAIDKQSIDRRRLANAILGYLSLLGEPEISAQVVRQFDTADNMTDLQAALTLLVDSGGVERETALESFYRRFRGDPLVVDKWFSVQAMCKLSDTLSRVVELSEHTDFELRNPNRVRSLVGAFAAGNQVRFHALDGAGYRFVADVTLALDGQNPQLAARLVSSFNPWRRFDAERRALMKQQLERIAAHKPLSKDVFEIVGRALSG
jgi:aminopeptidase N